MSEVITTTANRVKAGGYWCEDATAITQAALDKTGLSWDDEIPVTWGFESLGLANTILALGSVRPKFQKRADAITIKLLKELHSIALKLCEKVGFTVTDVGHWLGNPDRVGSRKTQYSMWQQLGQSVSMPVDKALIEAMAVLFSEQPDHLKCVHASKQILFVARALSGDAGAVQLRYEIINFLHTELDNG